MYDAIVIGGGFYGASIALYLSRTRGLRRLRLIEREHALLTRASFRNQARIHNGYHYPRSYLTAYRSRVNLPRFVADYDFAAVRDFTHLYAIARRNSKVSARQFIRFCHEIGARLEPAPPSLARMLNPELIEAAFLVQEYAFDAGALARAAEARLAEAGIEVSLGRRVLSCRRCPGGLEVMIGADAGEAPEELAQARHVFNCTYSGLNQFRHGFSPVAARLKHEITEIALVEMPPELRGLGLTVMDGPFFSAMPFPARGLHSLSHVRYTPHCHWTDLPGADPYERLAAYDNVSRADRMLRDAGRYLPAIAGATVAASLFEIKTVLMKNETDDGRPILFERSAALPGFYSVLGGKIDNIYDILGQLDREDLGKAAA